MSFHFLDIKFYPQGFWLQSSVFHVVAHLYHFSYLSFAACQLSNISFLWLKGNHLCYKTAAGEELTTACVDIFFCASSIKGHLSGFGKCQNLLSDQLLMLHRNQFLHRSIKFTKMQFSSLNFQKRKATVQQVWALSKQTFLPQLFPLQTKSASSKLKIRWTT